MSSYFIVNGRVIDPASRTDGKLSVLVRGGKIEQVTPSRKAPEGAQVLDASGCVVAPGFIDMHVHLRDPGQEYKEDIESGTRAAAAGGLATVCCMPNTDPVIDCASVAEYVLEKAGRLGATGVIPIGSITRGGKGEAMSDIGDLASAGACAISDDGRSVMNSGLMRRAMEYATAFGLPVISHCEDAALAGGAVMNEGLVSTELGLQGMPAAAEELMVARDIMLAELTGARLHIAHASTMGTVELIRRAKRRGIRVTAEVTPHHLTLTDEAVSDFDPNTKVNPPLRTEADRRALIKALADGTIDAIATDHAPHNIIDKEMGFEEAAFGISGLETMLPLALALVAERKLTLKRLVEALSAAPARILGLKGKGSLKPGSDADITIFDPSAAWTVDASRFASRGKNTPFNGLRVMGRARWTIVRGRIAFAG
ncbi:MAG: dihydroorotase [Proteobacteria bacterium]|nr:dihydroorotase [Pseudomonadota bacterium]